jgi:hypothetical protein
MKQMDEMTIEESKAIVKIMGTEDFKSDFSALLRTHYPIFSVITREENRLIEFLQHYCKAEAYKCYTWDSYRGVVDLQTGEPAYADMDLKDMFGILDFIIGGCKVPGNNSYKIDKQKDEDVRGTIFVLLDYFRFMELNENPDIERRLKEISKLEGVISTILTGPSYVSRASIENLIPMLDFPYPNKEEMKRTLKRATEQLSGRLENLEKETKKMEHDIVNCVSGLTKKEAEIAFAKSIVKHKTWDIPTILEEKRQIVNKGGILEYYEPNVSMKDVGGLKNLIEWIKNRKSCFSDAAEKYGLRSPRGLLLLGIPGCVTEETKIRVKKISEEGEYKIYHK